MFKKNINSNVLAVVLIILLISFGLHSYTTWKRITSEIQHIEQQYTIAQKQMKLFQLIESSLGYAGYIHHYNNYILHPEERYRERVDQSSKQLKSYLLQAHTIFDKDEHKFLVVLDHTLNRYNKTLEVIEQSASLGRSAREISDLIYVDDEVTRPALDQLELHILQRMGSVNTNIIKNEQRVWHLYTVGIASIILLVILGAISWRLLRRIKLANWEIAASREELASSDAHYKASLARASDAVLVLDEQGLISEVNPAASRMFFYDEDELLGQHINLLIPDGDSLLGISKGMEFSNQYLDLYLRCKGGGMLYGELRMTVTHVMDRVLITVMVTDISERHQEELRQQRDIKNLRTLGKITTYHNDQLASALQSALRLASHHLGLPVGIISVISDAGHKIKEYYLPSDLLLSEIDVSLLDGSVDRRVMGSGDVFGLNEPGKAIEIELPEKKQSLKSYLAAPFKVNGVPYGVVSFSSSRSYHRPFDEGDYEFMRLLASWVGAAYERALSAEQLQLSEKRLNNSQRFALLGNWDWNIRSGEMFWSEHIFEILGYSPANQENSYQKFLAAIHPDDQKQVEASIHACLTSHINFEAEYRVIRPNGEINWVFAAGNVVRDADENPINMLGVLRDVTQRKEAEVHLDVFRRIFDASDQSVGFSDAAGKMVYINKAFEALLGYRAEDLIGQHYTILLPEQGRDELMIKMDQLLKDGHSWSGQLTLCRADGSHVVSMNNLGVVRDEQGRIQHLFNLFSDFSEELARQEELRSSRDAAEYANRAKSAFLSSMSHELRTPMNAILGFAQLLELDDSLQDEQAQNVKEIMDAGQHLLALISDVLDLARIESGRVNLLKKHFLLDKALEECCQLMQPLAERSEVVLQYQTLPDVTLNTDRTRLKQVVINLLSNAIKYNRPQGIVELSVEQCSGNRVKINVSDSGKGIAKDKIEQLFQPFNRLGAENLSIEGTGIGLVITRQLVELMDGVVRVESELGVGSCFWLELPIAT